MKESHPHTEQSFENSALFVGRESDTVSTNRFCMNLMHECVGCSLVGHDVPGMHFDQAAKGTSSSSSASWRAVRTSQSGQLRH